MNGDGVAGERRRSAVIAIADVEEMEALGRRLAAALRQGDVVVLSGDLGAGKTALARGIGAGLGVRGPVTSPTFVIARVHPSTIGGPSLVHVDAYRVGSSLELDDLDLDASLEESVTVVEWGLGRAESLSPDRLHVDIAIGDSDQREVTITGAGSRWESADLPAIVSG